MVLLKNKQYKVRDFEDLSEENEVDEDGDIIMEGFIFFQDPMKSLCGKIIKLTNVAIDHITGKYIGEYHIHGYGTFVFSEDMLIPIEQECGVNIGLGDLFD